MNPNWTDAENWLDLIDHLWIGLVLIAVAAVPSYFAARNHQTIKKIEGQVVNGHKDAPPLRADLDKAITAIESLAHDVHGLRTDLAMEEDRRRQQIDELRKDVDRMRRR